MLATGWRRCVLTTAHSGLLSSSATFAPAGAAHLSDLLPEERRAAIDPTRNSKLYVKPLQDLDEAAPRAGKRIGF